MTLSASEAMGRGIFTSFDDKAGQSRGGETIGSDWEYTQRIMMKF